jgi:hypothetical protein
VPLGPDEDLAEEVEAFEFVPDLAELEEPFWLDLMFLEFLALPLVSLGSRLGWFWELVWRELELPLLCMLFGAFLDRGDLLLLLLLGLEGR